MKSWIKKIFGFGLASFFGDFNHEMTISLIPILVAQFVGPTRAPLFLGLISSLSDACASLMRLISGFLTDRLLRKKPLIVIGYAITALFSTMTGFAHSIWTVLLYRVLSFSGSGLREPPRDAIIATIIEPKYYGRAFGLRSAMDTLGGLIGPLVAFVCLGFFSMQGIFVLSFVPGLLAVLAIVFLTNDLNTSKKTTHHPLLLWQEIVALPRRFILFLGILFIFDLSNFSKLLLLSRAQEILSANPGFSSPWLVFLYAFFNIIRAIGELFIGLLSDYVNRIILLSIVGCGMFGVIPFLLIAPTASFLYYLLIFGIAGISTAAVLTLKKACAADMLPPQVRGLGYGTLQATQGFASLISSAIIGFLWVHYSPFIGFSYAIVLSLTATLSLFIFGLLHGATKHEA